MSKFSNCSRTDTNRSVFLPSREAVSRTGESRTIPCFAELFWLPWGRLLFLFHKLIRAERAAPRFRILVLHTASTLTKVLSFIYRGHSWGSHYLFALESKLLFSRPFCLHGVENGWLWSPRGTLFRLGGCSICSLLLEQSRFRLFSKRVACLLELRFGKY